MDSSPFTIDEKRFLLAEMIKSSTVDIDALVEFIHSNTISPDWMNMQLPHGRNMKRCIQVAEQIFEPLSTRTRESIGGQGERPINQFGGATNSPDQQPSPTAPATRITTLGRLNALAHIAPRPANGTVEDDTKSQSPPNPPARLRPSKKRGRPSKADMARRDLKPVLPRCIAPRTFNQMPGYQTGFPATGHSKDVSQAASLIESVKTAEMPELAQGAAKRRRHMEDSIP